MAVILNREFQIHKDINGYPSYLRTLLVAGDWMLLDPNTEQTFVVPTDSNLIIISKDAGNTLFVLVDDGSGSIAPPTAGTSTANSMVDINVVGVSVAPGQTVHVYSPVATYVKINYYKDGTIQ